MRRAFDAAAAAYDEAAVLQHEVGRRLVERLSLIRGLKPQRIVDLGSGTGRGARDLERAFRKAEVVHLDIAPGMLYAARKAAGWFHRQRFVCADVSCLPFAEHSVDLLFSSLCLQWCEDLPGVFDEWRRVLRPDGLVLFSTFGPDTLRELTASWQAVDGYIHTNRFTDLHDVGDALLHSGFRDPVTDVEHLTVTYPEALDLMRDLKAIGAHNVTAGRPRGLTGKGRLTALRDAYERFRQPDGRLPATYEVVYGMAWAPNAVGARRVPEQSIQVPLPTR